jgi:phage terminase large subunit-like protein
LIGTARKNGKSTLGAAIALYGLLFMGEAGPEVYSIAGSKDQARVVFGQAKAFVEASPKLQDWLQPYRNYIACAANGGVYRVLSSDAPLQHGLNPSIVVADELWAHRDDELYYALSTGQLARRNPLVVSVTTAGFDFNTICGRLYEHGKELAEKGTDAMREARFLFRWFQAPDECDLDDESGWRQGNPASWISMDDLRRERKRLPQNVFARLHLNRWTESEEAWLPHGAWEGCHEAGAKIPEGASVFLGVDVGTKRDCSAVVRIWKREDGKVVVEAEIFKPKGDGTALELATIDAAIARNAETYRVKEVVYDRWSFERSAQDLRDRGLVPVEIPMRPERMAPLSQRLFEAIQDQVLVHNGDPELTAHVNAGAVKEHERGWRLVKGKASRPIDGLMALCLAYGRLSDDRPQPFIDVIRVS